MKHFNVTHGHATGGEMSPTYRSWRSMRSRCENDNATAFERYGGAGVEICARWLSFENFLADMGERPEGKTLDRFPDGEGNYELSNCRWATPKQQIRHRSTTKMSALGSILVRQIAIRGASQRQLAYAFGVSQGMISMIRTGRYWIGALGDLQRGDT